MLSLGQKIQKIAGLAGTKDVSVWVSGFITNIVAKTNNGADTTKLTPAQVNTVESIHSEHFA